MKLFFQRLLCRIVAFLSGIKLPPFFLKPVVRIYANIFSIPLEWYDFDLNQSASFNQFFTRSFKPGMREFSGVLSAPAEGQIYAAGEITDGKMLQIKKQEISVNDLIKSDNVKYKGYINLYLSPSDYHHVHAPCDMEVISIKYIPGYYYTVAPATARKKPVYLRNERVVMRAQTVWGEISLVLIAALNVGNISLEPLRGRAPSGKEIKDFIDFTGKTSFRQGDQIAVFYLGSSVVLLSPGIMNHRNTLTPVKLGEALDYLVPDD